MRNVEHQHGASMTVHVSSAGELLLRAAVGGSLETICAHGCVCVAYIQPGDEHLRRRVRELFRVCKEGTGHPRRRPVFVRTHIHRDLPACRVPLEVCLEPERAFHVWLACAVWWVVRVSAMCYDGPRPRDGERQHVPVTPAEPASSPKNQPSKPGWNKSACRCVRRRGYKGLAHSDTAPSS